MSIEALRQRVNKLISGRQPAQLAKALEHLRQWQELQPGSFEALQRKIEIHLYQGQLEQASESLEAAASRHGRTPEFAYFSALLAQLRGELQQAMRSYARAIRDQRSSSQQAALNDAALQVAAAIQLCETAAGNYPGSPGKSEAGMYASGAALQELETALQRWEEESPGPHSGELRRIHGNAWYNLGCAALADFTADDRRIGMFQHAVQLDPGHILAHSNLAFAHNYSFSSNAAAIFQAHLDAGRWLEQEFGTAASVVNQAKGPAGRLRLGYLSSDFRQHSVAHFILPVLRRHDRDRFEIFVYHNHGREDSMTQQARLAAEHFRNVSRLSDAQLLQQIRVDGIEVLVDLNGLTEHHRLAVLAQRAAPVQISWMGYPNTTGLSVMDYRLVDRLTDPSQQTEPFCTETLVRLDAPFLAFGAPTELPDPGAPPCLENGYVTLGSFNALPKLNPPLLRRWAALLRQDPQARLLFKNPGMDFAAPRDQIRAVLAQEGIAAERLMFAGKSETQQEHLESYQRVDISLDSFPYNGTTTTCDSLLMGVPVVTIAGEEHRSRVGLSLLTAVGLESLVASDENSLSGIVTALAANFRELQNLRNSLRSRLLESPLGDAARLTTSLETELMNARSRSLNNMGNK